MFFFNEVIPVSEAEESQPVADREPVFGGKVAPDLEHDGVGGLREVIGARVFLAGRKVAADIYNCSVGIQPQGRG